MTTPKLHTSLAEEKVLKAMASGAVQRMGIFPPCDGQERVGQLNLSFFVILSQGISQARGDTWPLPSGNTGPAGQTSQSTVKTGWNTVQSAQHSVAAQ